MRRALIATVFAAGLLACRRTPTVAPEPPRAQRDASVQVADVVSATDASDGGPLDARADGDELPVMALPEVQPDARREPSQELLCVNDRGSPGRVALPVVPPELRAEVARYRLVVAQAMRCFEAYRVEHVGPQDCRAAATLLRRGGLAAMHAIGQFVYDEERHQLTTQEREAMRVSIRYGGMREVHRASASYIDAAETLVPVFGSFDAAEVIPYTLAALSHYARCRNSEWSAEGYVRWIEPLGRVSGWDLTPLPPWQQGTLDLEQSDSFASAAYVNWVRWYQAHKNETLEQWRASGLERARRSLTGRDLATRVAAILRLSSATASPEDREAARRSLIELMAERRLSNAGRRYMRDWAAQIGWTLDSGDAGASDGG